jgi:hypothetical protein
MIFKAIGLCWVLLKEYWKATGKCPMGKCFYWLGVMENLGNEAVSKQEARQNCPFGCRQKRGISNIFL